MFWNPFIDSWGSFYFLRYCTIQCERYIYDPEEIPYFPIFWWISLLSSEYFFMHLENHTFYFRSVVFWMKHHCRGYWDVNESNWVLYIKLRKFSFSREDIIWEKTHWKVMFLNLNYSKLPPITFFLILKLIFR